MARDSWEDGRWAWDRLAALARRARGSRSAGFRAGDEALAALADIGLLRRLLDQAELAAVRAARRHRKSWAEIAVTLGISRQSAWERWRELDDEMAAGRSAPGADPSRTPGESTTVETASPHASEVPAEVLERAAAEVLGRRRVAVPNVVGMSWDQARQTLLAAGLVAVGADPDAPPLGAAAWSDAVVTDQSPESGARVPAGSAVRLWAQRGGGSGVREPRRPKPMPRAARGALDEHSGEAIG